MPTLALEVKWNVMNVTNLKPVEPESFRWHIKVKCTNCGEERETWHYIVMNELMEVPNSRGGGAHLVEKCKLCARVNTLAIVADSLRPYSAEKNEEFQTILKLDCRGVEPYDFDPRHIDLVEKEWADYDEKASEAVEINGFACRFVQGQIDATSLFLFLYHCLTLAFLFSFHFSFSRVAPSSKSCFFIVAVLIAAKYCRSLVNFPLYINLSLCYWWPQYTYVEFLYKGYSKKNSDRLQQFLV